MRLEWDEQKNKTNIHKHGLDFADAWEIFTAPMLTALDDRADVSASKIERRVSRNAIPTYIFVLGGV